MINREANLAAIQLIATAIDDLNDEAVYVGGAVIGFYADPEFSAIHLLLAQVYRLVGIMA